MDANQIKKETQTKMDKTLESLKAELMKLRTGRANVAMLNDVRVNNYGNNVPLNQVGNMSTPDPKTILIQVWEKSMLAEVEKAVRSANLGLNPLNDGKVIRVPVPPLSEDRRKDLVKTVKKMGEESRVSIRNIRRDVNELLKKDKNISEDQQKRELDNVQKITDDYVKKVDELVNQKEAELMKI